MTTTETWWGLGVYWREESLGERDRTTAEGSNIPLAMAEPLLLTAKTCIGIWVLCQAGAWSSPWRAGTT